jgi:hypothetical protein
MTEFYRYLDIPPPPESMIHNAEKSIYKNLHKINGFNENRGPESLTINGQDLNYGQTSDRGSITVGISPEQYQFLIENFKTIS